VKPVVIVGAGLSGLAAGVALASRSISVLLLEQRPYAGGRAYSFRDRTTGDIVDNGQHLMIAGYTRTRSYLETVGGSHLLDIQETPELDFRHSFPEDLAGFLVDLISDVPGLSHEIDFERRFDLSHASDDPGAVHKL